MLHLYRLSLHVRSVPSFPICWIYSIFPDMLDMSRLSGHAGSIPFLPTCWISPVFSYTLDTPVFPYILDLSRLSLHAKSIPPFHMLDLFHLSRQAGSVPSFFYMLDLSSLSRHAGSVPSFFYMLDLSSLSRHAGSVPSFPTWWVHSFFLYMLDHSQSRLSVHAGSFPIPSFCTCWIYHVRLSESVQRNLKPCMPSPGTGQRCAFNVQEKIYSLSLNPDGVFTCSVLLNKPFANFGILTLGALSSHR